MLNKIFEISRRTNLMCTEDTFTDSPTYEQAYWSGDAQVSAAVSAFYFGEYELLKHNINQVPLGRKYTKLRPALMPTDWETAIPVWTMNWMITIEQYMYYTGDDAAGWELYDEIKNRLHPDVKVIMMSAIDDGNLVLEFIRKGVRDYVVKDEKVIQTLKSVIEGTDDIYFDE